MSRIGRMPITVPAGVEVTVNGTEITVKGKLGELKRKIDPCISIENKGGVLTLTRASESKPHKSKHGLYRALIANMVKGVSAGFEENLVVNGVGYKVAKNGNKIVMNIGYSHPIEYDIPQGLNIECPTLTEIKITGIDKEKVGQCAATLRSKREVEPYHGYGIRYKTEVVQRKEGKTAGK